MSIGLGPHLRMVSLGVLSYWCPACDRAHMINLSARGASWNHDGGRPTFTPDIRHTDGTGICHHFITAGRVEFLPDSTHILAGKTVPLPVFPHQRV